MPAVVLAGTRTGVCTGRAWALVTAGALVADDVAGVVAPLVEVGVDAPLAVGVRTAGADELDGAEFPLDPAVPKLKPTGPEPLLGLEMSVCGIVGCCTGADTTGLCCGILEAEAGSGAGLDEA